MKDFLLQIQILLRARYPVLYLVSHEEQRVIRALRKIAKAEQKEVLLWTSTAGIVSLDGQQTALEALEILEKKTNTILVFLDGQEEFESKQFIRRIRDLSVDFPKQGHALVFLAPILVVPQALEKLIASFDVPLPSAEEGAKLLEILCTMQNISIEEDLFQRFVQGALGLTEEEIKRMYSRISLVGNNFSEEDLSLQIEEKKRTIHSSRFLEFWDTAQIQSDIGGLESLKKWLDQRQLAFSPKAKSYGLPEPKGLFLLGVQGCGKSLMAKVVAKMWKLPLLRLDVASVLQVGVEQGLRKTIQIAETLSPVILWIDELEKGFASESESVKQGLGTFLTWMQEKQKPVFVVATANEVRNLPPELLRKGRFDEIFFVDLPNPHERLEILDIHLKLRQRTPEAFDLTIVVEETERFSGAELEQVVVSAMFKSFSEGRELDSLDLLETAREIVPLAVTMDDQLKDLRDWARSRARMASADRRRVDFFVQWEES